MLFFNILICSFLFFSKSVPQAMTTPPPADVQIAARTSTYVPIVTLWVSFFFQKFFFFVLRKFHFLLRTLRWGRVLVCTLWLRDFFCSKSPLFGQKSSSTCLRVFIFFSRQKSEDEYLCAHCNFVFFLCQNIGRFIQEIY